MTFAALALGCNQDDGRIDLQRLAQIEEEIRATPAVDAKPEQFALPEIKPFTVRSGDVLNITMIGPGTDPYAAVTLRARVQDDGNISLPNVGNVQVAGLDLAAIERAIIDAHVPSIVKAMSCNVDIAGPKTTTVIVQGAAGVRGLVTLQSDQRNVLYALGLAGGWGGSGRVRVRPIRPDREELAYDLTDINDLRRAMLGPPLESGDMVVVEGAPPNAVYMLGLLNAPGPLVLNNNAELSVSRAVASAGGLRDFLEPQEATLWRRLSDGRQVRVKVPLAKILAGKEPDFALRGGDIFDVPHTLDTRAREWLLANIRIGPFTVGSRYDPLAQYNIQRFRDDNNDDRGFGRALEDAIRLSVPDLLVPTIEPPAPRGP